VLSPTCGVFIVVVVMVVAVAAVAMAAAAVPPPVKHDQYINPNRANLKHGIVQAPVVTPAAAAVSITATP
jgi:hypothetical protein